MILVKLRRMFIWVLHLRSPRTTVALLTVLGDDNHFQAVVIDDSSLVRKLFSIL